jgi:hypothetical protein
MKLLIAACLTVACSAAQAGEIRDFYEASGSPKDIATVDFVPAAPPDHGITEIGIERTACFGRCPTYTFIVKDDGTFRYTGEANVDRKGAFTGSVPVGVFNWLAQFIRDSGYMQLKDGYTMQVTDLPSTYTMVVMNGQKKVVEDYGHAGPPPLVAAEILIDFLIEHADWN